MIITWDENGKIENGCFKGFYVGEPIHRYKPLMGTNGVTLRQVSLLAPSSSELHNHLCFLIVCDKNKNFVDENVLLKSAIQYVAYQTHKALLQRTLLLAKGANVENASPISKDALPKVYEMPSEIYLNAENLSTLKSEFNSNIQENINSYVRVPESVRYKYRVPVLFERFLNERSEEAQAKVVKQKAEKMNEEFRTKLDK